MIGLIEVGVLTAKAAMKGYALWSETGGRAKSLVDIYQTYGESSNYGFPVYTVPHGPKFWVSSPWSPEGAGLWVYETKANTRNLLLLRR